MGLSRNKVAVPEGAAGTPPFWRERLQIIKGSDDEKYGHRWFFVITFSCTLLQSVLGGLAQLARALAWHARGHRFDPDILHFTP